MSLLLATPAIFHKAAGGGGSWVPTDLGSKLRLWWDFTDSSVLYSDNPPTTTITNGTEILYVDDKSSSGNDGVFSAGTGYTTGPNWNSAGYAEYSDDRLAVTSLTDMTSDMALHVLISTSDTGFVLMGTNANNWYYGVAEDGDTGSITWQGDGAETITYEADGTALTDTRDALHAGWATGADVHAAVFGMDLLDVNVTEISPLAYESSSFGLTGNIKHVILTTNDLTAGELSSLETFMASE